MMKALFPALAAAALSICAACSTSPSASSEFNNAGISSAAQIESYLIELDTTLAGTVGMDSLVDTVSLHVHALIDWPVKMGDHAIAALQSRIIEAIGTDGAPTVNAALTALVDTAATFIDVKPGIDLSGVFVQPYNQYSMDVTLNRYELTSKYVTYTATTSQYMGGAHPGFAGDPFTFALDSAVIVTPQNAFTAEGLEAVVKEINNAAADQYHGTEGQLTKVGFFENTLPMAASMCIYNNAIIFHYNPYDVGPWAMGSVDITVYPGIIADSLTPLGRSLFTWED